MQRRRMVREVQAKLKCSERAACRCTGQPRSSQRYRSRRSAQQRNGERVLCDRMRELALRHPRYGYRRIGALLRSEGFRVNPKRVHRLWRKEALKVPQNKQHKRGRIVVDGSSENACHRKRPERIDHVWSFDFCHDRTRDGKSLKIFSVIDEYTRRCLAIRVSRRLTGSDVIATLKALIKLNDGGRAPEHVRCDNGTEFICNAMRRWLERSRVGALYIAPASPWENGYTESYHARLRDELLDREEFETLPQAQALLSKGRQEYNHERPHGALDYQTPMAFAAACRSGSEPASAPLRYAPSGSEPERREELIVMEKCCAVTGT